MAVEDERLRVAIGIAARPRCALEHCVEQLGDALAGLRTHPEHVFGRDSEHVLDLLGVLVRLGGGQVDLVQRGDDLEIVLERQVAIGQRLRFDPLRRIDDQDHALACGERPGHLVAEVDVAGCVDQVDRVLFPAKTHRLKLDRDAALALEVHRVEVLRLHVTRFDRSRQFEHAVSKRRLAVIDVRNDRRVANKRLVHGQVERSAVDPDSRGGTTVPQRCESARAS